MRKKFLNKIEFTQSTYISSSLEEPSYPHLFYPAHTAQSTIRLPEIALLGRSNVGKSSLINHLVKGGDRTKVSSTPGKTQTINFFLVDESLLLVDLPGYGYAKVAKHVQTKWTPSLENYLKSSRPLALSLLLIDIRRGPSSEDLLMARWCAEFKKPLAVVFTKNDQVKDGERTKTLNMSMELLDAETKIPIEIYILYSVHSKESRQALIYTINQFLSKHIAAHF